MWLNDTCTRVSNVTGNTSVYLVGDKFPPDKQRVSEQNVCHCMVQFRIEVTEWFFWDS